MESKRVYWALHYVNGDYYLGQFQKVWTRSDDIDLALLFDSQAECDQARQAFIEDAHKRMDSASCPRWLFDVIGGVLECQEVLRILRPIHG